jgi:hypothetical protein
MEGDVLQQAGVTHVIFFEGSNDLARGVMFEQITDGGAEPRLISAARPSAVARRVMSDSSLRLPRRAPPDVGLERVALLLLSCPHGYSGMDNVVPSISGSVPSFHFASSTGCRS